jgi:hypothetical protein
MSSRRFLRSEEFEMQPSLIRIDTDTNRYTHYNGKIRGPAFTTDEVVDKEWLEHFRKYPIAAMNDPDDSDPNGGEAA